MFDFDICLAVVFIDVSLTDSVAREHLQKPPDAALNKVNARGFERLDEAAGQADGDAIAFPCLAALAGPELDDARLGEHLALYVGQQPLFGRIVGEITAAVHHSVADAMLQRDAP